MLNEEVKKYRELSGDNNPHTPISRIGGYLDGYEKAMEQKTGHWIEEKSKVYKCSNCGRYALEWGGQLMMSRYCSNCGAKMGESEGENDN